MLNGPACATVVSIVTAAATAIPATGDLSYLRYQASRRSVGPWVRYPFGRFDSSTPTTRLELPPSAPKIAHDIARQFGAYVGTDRSVGLPHTNPGQTYMLPNLEPVFHRVPVEVVDAYRFVILGARDPLSMLRVHVKMANELEALADFAEVVKCRRAVVWLMRDLSPRPNEKPASAKQRQWVAEWTVVVTDAMARLAHCLVQPPNDCVTEAVQWYTTAIALRVRQFGHGGIRLCEYALPFSDILLRVPNSVETRWAYYVWFLTVSAPAETLQALFRPEMLAALRQVHALGITWSHVQVSLRSAETRESWRRWQRALAAATVGDRECRAILNALPRVCETRTISFSALVGTARVLTKWFENQPQAGRVSAPSATAWHSLAMICARHGQWRDAMGHARSANAIARVARPWEYATGETYAVSVVCMLGVGEYRNAYRMVEAAQHWCSQCHTLGVSGERLYPFAHFKWLAYVAAALRHGIAIIESGQSNPHTVVSAATARASWRRDMPSHLLALVGQPVFWRRLATWVRAMHAVTLARLAIDP